MQYNQDGTFSKDNTAEILKDPRVIKTIVFQGLLVFVPKVLLHTSISTIKSCTVLYKNIIQMHTKILYIHTYSDAMLLFLMQFLLH